MAAQLEPFALRNTPSLLESVFPAQKISVEAQKEREGKQSQTLTALGSYWKGRKPLVLARAIILGSLLPQSGNQEKDLEIFEKLMAIDDNAFVKREPDFRPTPYKIAQWISLQNPSNYFEFESEDCAAPDEFPIDLTIYSDLKISWKDDVTPLDKDFLRKQATKNYLMSLPYKERAYKCKRAEQIDPKYLYAEIWDDVNHHLRQFGIKANSHEELVEQLGILRFGQKPKVGDTFCGGGSIPFEAARLGCDIYASDLNPVGCMLTWGAINIIGASEKRRKEMEEAQNEAIRAIDKEITELGIEHNEKGDRAKAYLYCLETVCPQTGWNVPLIPNWIISTDHRVVAKPVPDHKNKRFQIEVVNNASNEELKEAKKGTVQNNELVYSIDDENFSIPLRTIRGDWTKKNHITGERERDNALRKWKKHDYKPTPNDIFQERLYAVQWIKNETINDRRWGIYVDDVKDEDIKREKLVEQVIQNNLEWWQEEGLIPDMKIEPGANNSQPIWEKGWTYWHHLFNPRQLIVFAFCRKHEINPIALFQALNWNSKLSPWDSSRGQAWGSVKNTFYNQALNTMSNWGCRSYINLIPKLKFDDYKREYLPVKNHTILPSQATHINVDCDLFITDPPYADAINYHEITEFFTAWLKKNPPKPFNDWIWDTRRPLAIQGRGDSFRKRMVEAYSVMANHMPDNGLQCVMFTHQDTGVWSDMTSIFWGAGLQVFSAWYIATETNAAYKKGGFVQGTVILVLRKRPSGEHHAFTQDIAFDIKEEVEGQINTLVGLNEEGIESGRSENIFEDADLQMAGYAAALRILTGYTHVDGEDMRKHALRPRQNNEQTIVDEIVQYASEIANSMLYPHELGRETWEALTGPERFYLKMLDIEETGAKKLDNYQNFAKAFKVEEYKRLMANSSPNSSRLKGSSEFTDHELGTSLLAETLLGDVLYAMKELQKEEANPDEVVPSLREAVSNYYNKREHFKSIASYLDNKLQGRRNEEARAARVLYGQINTEQLGS